MTSWFGKHTDRYTKTSQRFSLWWWRVKWLFFMMALLLFGAAVMVYAVAAVTPATGGTNISADTALNASGGGSWTVLSGPVVTETQNRDIPNNNTFVLRTPTGFIFNTGSRVVATISIASGSTTCFSFSSGGAIPTTTWITFTINGRDWNNAWSRCKVVFSGIQVKPLSGASLASGNLYNAGTNAWFLSWTANSYGALSVIPGTGKYLDIVLPGQTFTINSWHGGTASTQTGWTAFTLTWYAFDQFRNIITLYTGSKSLTFSGPAWSYPSSATFASGIATWLSLNLTWLGTGISLSATGTSLLTPLANAITVRDTILPVVSLITPTSWAYLTGNTLFTRSWSDNIAVSWYTFYVYSWWTQIYSSWLTSATTWISFTTWGGIYTWNVVATDTAWNTGTAINRPFTMDKTAPTASVTYNPWSWSYTSGNVMATITWFSESITGLNATWHLFTGNGTFLFTFQDLAGNIWYTTGNVTWIDKIPPTFAGVTSWATYTWSKSITFSDNNTWVTATLSGVSYVSGQLITGNGTYVFVVTDAAGNTTWATFTINIDTTAPTFAWVTSWATYGWVLSWTLYVWNVSITFDDADLSWATLDGVVYTSWTVITATWTHVFIVSDHAGNSTWATFTIQFTLDQQIFNDLVLQYAYVPTDTTLIPLGVTALVWTAAIDLLPYSGQVLVPVVLQSVNALEWKIAEVAILDTWLILKTPGWSFFTGTLLPPVFLDPVVIAPALGTTPISVIKVWTTGQILLKDINDNPIYSIVRMPVPGRSEGDLIDVYSSEDGIAFTYLTTAQVKLVAWANPYVNFTSPHFSIFTTVAGGGAAISADSVGGAYTTLNGPSLAEWVNRDIQPGTIVFTAPTGFRFNTWVSSVRVTISRIAGSASCFTVSSATATPTASTITFTVTNQDGGAGGGTTICTAVFSGIQVRPTAGTPLATGNITNAGTAPGVATGTTSYGALTEVFGTGKNIIVTLSGQTFLAGTGNTGTGINQLSGIQFQLAKLTAVDQFKNIITSYNWAKTISYTGIVGTYTTAVSFTSGQSTTTLNTTLRQTWTWLTLTATDGTLTGLVSSPFDVTVNTPTLVGVHITSNNANSWWYAKIGNLITLSFTWSISLTWVSATIAGHAVTITGTGTLRSWTYTMITWDTEWIIPFTIDFQNLVGTTWAQVTSTTDSSQVIFDKTLPTFAWVTSWISYSWNVSITFSDTHLSWATLDGAAYTSWTVISTTWTHIFIVSDYAGNSTGATFTIDKTIPTFAWVTSWAFYSWNVSITFDDADLSWATLDGVVYTSGATISSTWTHIFIVYDKAGNTAWATFTIDKTIPTFAWVTSWAYYLWNVSITFSDTYLSWATLDWLTYTSGTTISSTWTHIFIVYDKAGNSTGATFAIDHTIPTFAWVTSWAFYSWNVSITFDDADLSWATLDWLAYTSWTLISSTWTHIFIVYDKAWNTAWATFTIDKTIPTFAWVVSWAYYSWNVSITFDDADLSWATLDGAAYTSGTIISSTWTHIFIVYDKAGNTAWATFTIDKDIPTATVSYNPETATNGNVIATLTWYGETLTWINTTTHTFTGNGSFIFTFQDLAGNTWSTTATVNWIDTTTPTASVIYTITWITNQNVIATLTGFNKTWVTVTNNSWTSYTFTWNTSFTFQFVDALGNTWSTFAEVTWIDRDIPTASVSYSITWATNQNVIATLTSYSKPWTIITNNSWLATYTFTWNGSFIYTFVSPAGNTWSALAEVSWIDKTKPSATVIYNISWATNQDVIATLTWFTKTWVTVTNNGFSDMYTFTWNGNFTFEFVDSLGNTWSALAEVSWIDKTKPSATVIYTISWATNQDVIATLTWFTKTWVIVTNNSWTSYTFTSDGSFTFEFVDSLGNTWSALAEVSWIDKTKPSATVIYLPETATNQNVIATLTGFTKTWVTVTNNSWLSYTFTGNGSFTFEFVDAVGNTWSTTATVGWIDTSKPSATVIYNISWITNQDVIATLTWFTKTWVTVTNNGFSDMYTFTWNGNFTFEFEDALGNTWSAFAEVTWIDKTPVIGSINYDITWATNQNVTATISFVKTWVTVTNNSGVFSYVFTGNRSFTFEFTDAAGNTWSETATVSWINTTKPTATISYNPATATSGNVVATIASFSKPGVTITNNGWLTHYTFTWDGSFTFEFVDVVGNTWSATATVGWIDKTKPSASIDYAPATATNGNVIATLTWLTETWVTITNNSWSTEYIFTGNGSFTFNFTDAVGNTWSETATVNWIDTTTPTATIDYAPATATNGNVIATLTWFTKTWVTVTNNGFLDTYTFTGNGSFTFEFEDALGNTWSETATVNWIDKSPVTGSIVYYPTSVTNQNVTATISFVKTWVTVTNNSGLVSYVFTGDWSFTFEFIDAAGNTWSETAMVSWIDTSPVIGSIDYDITWATNQNVTATISFVKTWVTITSNGWSATHMFTWDGSFTFYFTDLAGNTWSETAEVSWIDKIKPSATVEYVPLTTTNGSVVAILTWFTKTWVTVTNNGLSGVYIFTGNGSFTFEFEDAAGNTWSALATVDWIDTSAVTGSISYSTTWLTNQNVTGTISFNKTWVTVNNNSGLVSYVFTGDGSFTFEFTDAAGNTWTETATVSWIDKTPPTLTEITPIPTPSNDFSPQYTFHTTEPGAIIYYSWACSSITDHANSGNNTITFDILATWTYTDCKLNVTDHANNTSDRLVLSPFTVTLTAPTGYVTYDIPGLTNTDVIATLTGFSETWITITNNSWSAEYTFTGNGSFTFHFIDVAGNTWSVLATVNWIDKEAPVVSLLITSSGTIFRNFTGTVPPQPWATWIDTVDGTWTITTYTSGTLNLAVAWTYVLEYGYTDAAGNYWFATSTWNVIDSTSVIINIIAPNPYYIEFGDSYVEYWARRFDIIDGIDFVPSTGIVVDVNTGVLGTWIVTYTYVNTSGITWTNTRDVIVRDTTAPAIILNWSATEYIEFGSWYSEQWATWTDAYDISGTVSDITWIVDTWVLWTYIVTYTKVDSSWNTGTAHRTVIVQDTVSPSVVLSTSNPDPTNTVIHMTAQFSEAVTWFTTWIINLSNWTISNFISVSGSTYTFDVTPALQWSVNIHIDAADFTDLAGNNNLASSVFSIVYDTIKPISSTLVYDITWSTNQNVTVIITWFNEPITWLNATWYTFTWNGSFEFTFADLAGNTWSKIATVDWIDVSSVTWNIIYDITWITNTDVIATISFTKTWVIVTNNSWSSYTFTWDWSFTFEFTDAAGNTWSETATVSWIDKEFPTYTWVVDGSMNITPVTVRFSDNRSWVTAILTWLVYDIWDNLVATWYVFTDGMLINIDWVYTITITDLAGNVTSVHFNYDDTVPSASVAYTPWSWAYTSGDVYAYITWFNEILTGISATGHLFTGNGSFEFTFQDPGWFTGSVTATVDWIDKEAPAIELLTPSSGTVVHSGTLYSRSGSDDKIISWYLFSVFSDTWVELFSMWFTTTWITLPILSYSYLTNGNYIWTVTAIDTAGNSTISPDRLFTIDKSGAVMISLISDPVLPTYNSWHLQTITFLSESSEYPIWISNRVYNASWTLVFSTGEVERLNSWYLVVNFPWNTAADGTYTLCSNIRDLGDNITLVCPGTVTVDRVHPTASIEYVPLSGAYTSGDVMATLTWFSEDITWWNADSYLFTWNGSFEFTFTDLAGNTWSVTATVDWIDKEALTGSIGYDITWATNHDVIATISFFKPWVTITNNGWLATHTFTGNASFIFDFVDGVGTTWSLTATVGWIDKEAVTWYVMYDITWATNSDVIATLTGLNKTWIIITNNSWSSYTFTNNGSFTFDFTDVAGNTWSATAMVDRIDKITPTATVTYDITWATYHDVIATLDSFSKPWIVITNNWWSAEYMFTGNGSFIFLFRDAVGNTWSTTAMVDWIDKEPLIWTINYDITWATNQNVTATISFNKTWVTINNNSWLFTYTFTDNDLFIFNFTDAVGNTWSETATVGWIDKETPSITLTAPASGMTLLASTIFMWTGSDNTAISWYVFQAFNASWIEIITTWMTSIWLGITWIIPLLMYFDNGNGEYTWTVTAIDIVGNTTTAPLRPFIIQKTAPLLIQLYTEPALPAYNSWYLQNIQIYGSAAAYPIRVTHNIYNSTWAIIDTTWEFIYYDSWSQPYSFPWDTLIDGVYTLCSSVRDAGENISTNCEWDITIDRIHPTASVEYIPLSGALTSGNVMATLTGLTEDITWWNATWYLFTGNGSFEFTFTDLAGNTWAVMATVDWIDSDVPLLTGIVSVPAYINTTTPSYTFNSTKVGTISYSWDCSSVTTWAISGDNTIVFDTLSTWLHDNCMIRVTSLALVDSDRLAIAPFTIDIMPPSASLEYIPWSGTLTSGNVEAIITWFTEAITWLNATGHLFSDNGDFEFTFADLAGNTWSVWASVSWIDYGAPILAELTGVPTPTNNITPSYTFSSDDEWTIIYSWSCSSVTTWAIIGDNIITFDPLLDGLHDDCMIKVTDDAGNESLRLPVSPFTIDTSIPTAYVTYDISSWTNTDVVGTITWFDKPISRMNTTWHTFTGNEIFVFEFTDAAGNTWYATGNVTWIDKIMPTFAWVDSWTEYTAPVSITFDDVNISWALLNGVAYASGDVISSNGSFEFVVSDLAGNTTWASFTINITAPVVNTSILSWDLIAANANAAATFVSITWADVATWDQRVIASDMATYTWAIATAQAIYDNPASTQSDVDSWVEALSWATAIFNAVKLPGTYSAPVVNTSILSWDLIAANANAAATFVSITWADVATWDQRVIASDMATYTWAIATAQAIYDNPASTQSDVDGAVSDLATATSTFNGAKAYGTFVSPADKSILSWDLASANANAASTYTSIDGSDIATWDQRVTAWDMATYTWAIATAQAVYAATWSTQTDVDNAVITLSWATAAFNSAKAYGTYVSPADKSILSWDLASANANAASTYTSIDGSDIATWNQRVTAWDMATYTWAIATAQAVYDNTWSTQTDVDSWVEALSWATAIFNAVKLPGTYVADITPPELTLIGANPQYIIVWDAYIELWASAYDTGDGGDISAFIVINTWAVNTSVTGSYTVYYNVSDSHGNAAVTGTRTVNVITNDMPLITLLGTTPITIEVGSSYSDAWATASDTEDGDLTSSIVTSGTVNTALTWTYYITYDVSDSSGNAAVQVIRTINVTDTIAPVITLLGDNPQNIVIWNPYVELGATAYDTGDGDLSSYIVIDSWALNMSLSGSYSVLYTVSDSSGNPSTGTRIVNVVNPIPVLSSIYSTVLSWTSAEIHFTTNIAALGFVRYGIGALTSIMTGSTGTSHTIVLDGLTDNVTYNYRVFATTATATGDLSDTWTFTTPKIITTDNVTWTVIVDWSATITDATSTWASFTTTGTLIITSGSNTLELDLSWLNIIASGTWNKILLAPQSETGVAEFLETWIPLQTETVWNTTTTRVILETVSVGWNVSLSTNAWNYFRISFIVPSWTVNQVLKLYRSEDGNTWVANTPDATCTLNGSLMCSFLTDTLSYFAWVGESTSTTSNGWW